MWCRTWYDAETEQMRRVSLGERDFSTAHKALVRWFLENHCERDAKPADVLIETALLTYYNGHAQHLPSAQQARIACDLWRQHFTGEAITALTIPRQERFVDWLRARKLSAGYISRTLSVGRAAINRLNRRGELASAPFIIDVQTQDDRMAVEPKGRPLAIEEMGQIFDAAKSDHIFMFCMVSVATLQRPNAVLDVTQFQVDHDHDVIDFNPPGRRQTKKVRAVVRIPAALKPWLPQSGAGHLVHYHGRQIGSIKTAWRALRKTAGLDDRVNPYSIRHTMGRELRRRRVPADQISIMLGHRPVNVKRTDLVYSPFDPDYLTDAAAAIDEYFGELQKHTKRALTAPVDNVVRASFV